MGNNIPQKWINTPFSYTKLSQNLTLLQQNVLVKVSAYLQSYLQEYFGNDDMRNNRARPKPLFSELTKKTGIGQIVLSYAELGVSPNNYDVAKKAVHHVLDMKWENMYLDKDGKPQRKTYNIFTEATESLNPGYNDAQGVIFSFNQEMMEEVVDQIFDMQYGYVSHPEDIARIASMEKVPLLYYLLKHKSRDWKQKVIDISPFDIKDYIGLVERDENKNIKEIKYRKFSQFKERVLTPAMYNINHLYRRGLLDIYIRYESIYVGAKKTGDPDKVRFFIDNTKARPLRPYEDKWIEFLEVYDGALKEMFESMKFLEFQKGVVIFESDEHGIELFNCAVDAAFVPQEEKDASRAKKQREAYSRACKKVFGKDMTVKFSVTRK